MTAAGAGPARVSGRCAAVVGAADADWLLVCGTAPGGGCALATVPVAQRGVDIAAYRLLDGRGAADVRFDQAEADFHADGPTAAAAAAAARELWLAAGVADALGVMSALLKTTADYLRTRVQFGVPIGSFQALQHRLADMHVATLELRALLRAWTRAVDDAAAITTTDDLRRASLRLVRSAGRRVGQEAIQMHGGIGLTEELWVSHGNARLRTIASLLPTADAAADTATDTATDTAADTAAATAAAADASHAGSAAR